MELLPKVVILSKTSLSCSNATGSFLANLFKPWPPERLLQISNNISDDEIGSQYNLKFKVKFIADKFFFLRYLFIFSILPLNILFLMRKIRAFKPDMIYVRVVDEPIFYVIFGRILAKKFNVPLVTHTMDDYDRLLSTSNGAIKRSFLRLIFRQSLRKLFDSAQLNFSISEKMTLAYEKKFRNEFHVLHNGIDPDDWADTTHENNLIYSKNKPFQIVYAGSVDPLKEEKIIGIFAGAVHNLNSVDSKIKYEFIINTYNCYIPTAENISKKYKGIKFQSFLSITKYRQLLQNADLLLIARDFDCQVQAYTELSFHNKLPEYMASGTPILCVGPKWDNSLRFIDENQIGYTVTKESIEALQFAIKLIYDNYNEYADMAGRAQSLAFSIFNINLIRSEFIEKLLSVHGCS
ncbi:MAG: glycosyltransferase [Dissulfuribacterales bacterium]